MSEGSYRQFCPVAMASEILGARWTMNLVRELVAGSTRFNELRRGLPRMSPALLSKRLRDLEEHGIVSRAPTARDPEVMEYRLTPSGEELAPIIEAIGVWGHRWTHTHPQLENLDAGLLMWDLRRNLRVDALPPRRKVIQFIYPEQSERDRNWWIVVDPEQGPDLCSVEPGFDVDLYVCVDLRTMTAVWMGIESAKKAIDDERLVLTGDQALQRTLLDWIGLSIFAGVEKQVP